jgi:hypothetical protein
VNFGQASFAYGVRAVDIAVIYVESTGARGELRRVYQRKAGERACTTVPSLKFQQEPTRDWVAAFLKVLLCPARKRGDINQLRAPRKRSFI